MAHQVGESIGHYQIVEEIGEGGNGRVLAVQHLITRRREAMKILARGRPNSQDAHRVLREIRLQASLDHPNIATVLNAFWLEDDLIMIMELIEGTSLQKLLARRRLNLDQSLNIIKQVLMALSYAHGSKVVHRDVSTANIIVNEEGKVKLTDFGLAKDTADLNVTETGAMAGSPYYISPEQVRNASQTDHRSDIYSTGVVLYEMLTGRKPFEDDSSFALMQAHVQQLPVPPIDRNPSIPHFISQAVLKAMSKNAADRFKTAVEFLAALEGPAEKSELSPPEPQVEKPLAPAAISHSYAAPLPAGDQPVSKKQSKTRRVPIFSSLSNVAVFVACLLIAIVAPIAYFDGQAGRLKPDLTVRPQTLPDPKSTTVSAPSAEQINLTSGPKTLPVLPEENSSSAKRNATAKRMAPSSPKAVIAPKILVWGDAKSNPPERQNLVAENPVTETKPAQVIVPAKKVEEPPALTPSAAKAAIEPPMPQPGTTIQRRSLLRRLASGVKSLNPVRKSSNQPDPAPMVKP